MKPNPDSPSSSDGGKIDSAGGCLLLVFSQFGGALVLGVLALLIAMREPWQFSWLDFAYAAVLVAWLLAQRAQRAREVPKAGDAAAPGFSRGSVLSLLGALLTWLAAHLVEIG